MLTDFGSSSRRFRSPSIRIGTVLLGYLLGALDPEEMQRVANWLREDPEAREQLAELERMIRPLEEAQNR